MPLFSEARHLCLWYRLPGGLSSKTLLRLRSSWQIYITRSQGCDLCEANSYNISFRVSYMLTRFAYEIGASAKLASPCHLQKSSDSSNRHLWHRNCQCKGVRVKTIKGGSYDNQTG